MEHQEGPRGQCGATTEEQTSLIESRRPQEGFQSLFWEQWGITDNFLSEGDKVKFVFWKDHSECKVVAENESTFETHYS